MTTAIESGLTGHAELEHALCRSALYEALAMGFRRPEAATIARLATPAGAAGLVAAALAVGGPALAARVERLGRVETRPDALGPTYERLFGHVARAEVPLFETEYGGDEPFLQPHTLADLGGFYDAFGLTLAPRAATRPDHVACECEFLMFLARKEAFALAGGDDAMLEVTRRATRVFVRDHLATFVPALAARLVRADASGFYGALAALARAVVRTECERLDVAAGPEALRLRTLVDDGMPAACGSCPIASPDVEADGD